jgi:hypothetical protein
MAPWYSLGCSACRLLLALHKFLPTDAWYARFDDSRFDRHVFPGQGTYCAIQVPADRFEKELAALELASEPDYVQKLVPGLVEFIKAHHGHQLFVISDLGDQPWDFPGAGWWQWKEKPVAFDFHTYLPRCLIEDLGIRD